MYEKIYGEPLDIFRERVNNIIEADLAKKKEQIEKETGWRDTLLVAGIAMAVGVGASLAVRMLKGAPIGQAIGGEGITAREVVKAAQEVTIRAAQRATIGAAVGAVIGAAEALNVLTLHKKTGRTRAERIAKGALEIGFAGSLVGVWAGVLVELDWAGIERERNRARDLEMINGNPFLPADWVREINNGLPREQIRAAIGGLTTREMLEAEFAAAVAARSADIVVTLPKSAPAA